MFKLDAFVVFFFSEENLLVEVKDIKCKHLDDMCVFEGGLVYQIHYFHGIFWVLKDI